MHLQASECHGAVVVDARLLLIMFDVLCSADFFPILLVSLELYDPSLDQLYENLQDVNFFSPFGYETYDIQGPVSVV